MESIYTNVQIYIFVYIILISHSQHTYYINMCMDYMTHAYVICMHMCAYTYAIYIYTQACSVSAYRALRAQGPASAYLLWAPTCEHCCLPLRCLMPAFVGEPRLPRLPCCVSGMIPISSPLQSFLYVPVSSLGEGGG